MGRNYKRVRIAYRTRETNCTYFKNFKQMFGLNIQRREKVTLKTVKCRRRVLNEISLTIDVCFTFS